MIDKRLMYAKGQRVGFRGGGGQIGGTADMSGGSTNNNTSGEGDSGSTNREKGIMSQYSGPKGTTGNINDFTGDKDGVDRSAVGPKSKYASNKFREGMLKSLKEVQTNPKYGGGGFFDTGPGKFIKGIGKTALMAYAPQIFGPKFATGMKAYKTAKVAKDFLNNTTVGTSLTNLFNDDKTPTNKSISKTGTGEIKFGGDGGDGQNGIAGLEAISLLENEYILLLQKLQAGSISENDKSRFGVLKQMLGK